MCSMKRWFVMGVAYRKQYHIDLDSEFPSARKRRWIFGISPYHIKLHDLLVAQRWRLEVDQGLGERMGPILRTEKRSQVTTKQGMWRIVCQPKLAWGTGAL